MTSHLRAYPFLGCDSSHNVSKEDCTKSLSKRHRPDQRIEVMFRSSNSKPIRKSLGTEDKTLNSHSNDSMDLGLFETNRRCGQPPIHLHRFVTKSFILYLYYTDNNHTIYLLLFFNLVFSLVSTNRACNGTSYTSNLT